MRGERSSLLLGASRCLHREETARKYSPTFLHFLDDDCINDGAVSPRKWAPSPLFVSYRYVARQDSRLIRGSAGRGKAPFNAFRTDIYPALSQWKLIAWFSNSLTRFSPSLSLSFANQYRFQEILEQIILTINYFELELVRDKRKKKKRRTLRLKFFCSFPLRFLSYVYLIMRRRNRGRRGCLTLWSIPSPKD